MPGVLNFFIQDDMLPHAFCLAEHPFLIRLHIASDAITAMAYYSIPLALGYFAYKRREDIPFTWMFLLFGAFILLCGTTHVFDIWTLYVPDYYAQGVLKAATAITSIGTAVATWRLMPTLLQLPGPEKLRRLNGELESLVAVRTSELSAALQEKESLLNEAYHRAAIVRSSDDAIVSFDVEGVVTEWNQGAERLLGQPANDMLGRNIHGDDLAGVALMAECRELLQAVEEGHPVETREISETAGKRVDVSIKASPIRGANGSMQGVSIIARDISERLRDQERMRVASMEVDHRARNMMAVVMAMIRMTRHDPACAGFVDDIQGRIDALSATHAAVVENQWDGARVSEILDRTLKPYIASQKITYQGADVFIRPAAVQALGVVIHELATNALKHGALSVATGRTLIDV